MVDLQRHAEELAEKYVFLTDAPATDPDGNETLIRFDRATKTQYVSSQDAKGEATGWSAWYEGDRWVAKTVEKTASKKKPASAKT